MSFRILAGLFVMSLIGSLAVGASAESNTAVSQKLELSVHYHGYDPGQRERDISRLRQIVKSFGATSVKADAGWNMIEPKDGQFDFQHVDYVCEVVRAVGCKLKLIVNNGWSVPNWLWQYKEKSPFALNAADQTGRQGSTAGTELGKYPAPVLLAYSNPWVLTRIRTWQSALVRHVETKYPGLVNEYICEGEIYLNPDNDFGDLLFDYNPWTLKMFQKWLREDTASPYYDDNSPDSGSHTSRQTLNQRWKTNWLTWEQIQPPRHLRAGDAQSRDWCAFLQYYVAWSYREVARGLREQTRLPIAYLLNSFTGIPMPNDHVWGPSRTQDQYWQIYKMTAPYVNYLGMTAYHYDPGYELDVSGAWDVSMAFMETCSRLLKRPVQIVEGGPIMRARTLSDLRWQLFSAYAHNLGSLIFGYFGMPEGQNRSYDWTPALNFPLASELTRRYAQTTPAPVPAPRIAILYSSPSELLAPGSGVEARAVRTIGRQLRNAHYRFDVLDTAAIEDGSGSLSDYRAVFLPGSHAMSATLRQQLRRSFLHGTVVLLDRSAGTTTEWGDGSKPIIDALKQEAGKRDIIILNKANLAAEQAYMEAGKSAPIAEQDWLTALKAHLAPDLPLASPFVTAAYRQPTLLFNRSAEQAVRETLPEWGAITVPPGVEAPPMASVPAPTARGASEEMLCGDPTVWSAYGLQRPTITKVPDGLRFMFPANAGPPAVAEIRLMAQIPFGRLARIRSIQLAWRSTIPTALPQGTRLLLRLYSITTGRSYEVPLPISAEKQTRTFDLARDFGIPSADRRRELDRIEFVVSGFQWPETQMTLLDFKLLNVP